MKVNCIRNPYISITNKRVKQNVRITRKSIERREECHLSKKKKGREECGKREEGSFK